MASPQSLPFDIIQEILAHHSTPLLVYSNDVSNSSRFPWFLGHICSSWRTVFLSMYAEFWSSVIMSPRTPLSAVDGERSLEIITTFIERTDGRPFSLSIHLRYIPRPVIDIFVKHSKQWQHVELIFDQKQLWLLSPIKDQLPLLCSLRLGYLYPTPVHIDPPEPIVLFQNAPLLTHVRLHHMLGYFHWPSLSYLQFHGNIKLETLLGILSQLANLQTLHIMNGDKSYATTNSTMAITMIRLKVLRTSDFMNLAFLTAPSLEILHIGTGANQNFPSVCSAFIGRSSCRLLHLSIGYCTSENLASILTSVATIETLYVGCKDDFFDNPLGEFFHTLACPLGEPLQAPELHTIRFSIISLPIGEEDVIALRSMITLRRLATSPRPKLRQIVILPCQDEFFEVWDRVLKMLEKLGQECEMQGISLIIKPVSYEDLVTPFYDGNHHFNLHFTPKLHIR